MTKKINLLLPIAGQAKRFLDESYVMPKPLIMVNNEHMIDVAMESIDYSECNLIFVVMSNHIHSFSIDTLLREKFGDDIEIVIAEELTDGAVSSCLLATEYIDNNMPLIIYTPDVCFEPVFNPVSEMEACVDGRLLLFKANSPDHSYAEIDTSGLVIKTAEKKVISSNAAVGMYCYKKGSDFVKYATQMIDQNIRVNNEFYICPLYNLMIRDGLKISGSFCEKMYVLGTPKDLLFYTRNVIPKFGADKPVALCSDHSGYSTKELMKKILKRNSIPFIDLGTSTDRDCDYSDFVLEAVRHLKEGICDFGLGFCRTGQGINIAANKHKKIRSALIFDEYTAEYAVRHNCANFFSVASNYVDELLLDRIVKILKAQTFDGGRHATRILKVEDV